MLELRHRSRKGPISEALATLQALVKISLIIALLLLGFQTWGAVLGHVSGYVAAAITGLSISIFMLRDRNGP